MATAPPDPMRVFDRALLRRRRGRAAPNLAEHDFLLREVAERLAERLDDVRPGFPLALDLGCHGGQLGRALGARGGIETLVQADLSPAMARMAGGHALAADEEALPFAPASFDLALSAFSLHWVNDLPGALLQLRHCLKPDGLFLAAMAGGETLWELRASLLAAEAEICGGASPRASPSAGVADLGGLLQRAGFALPVIDVDTITVSYTDPLALMRDLRGMGEANAVHARQRTLTPRALLSRAAEIYHARHGNAEGRVPATFQILFLTGWAPHETQPRALRPGSAAARLAEALDVPETTTGVKARPAGHKCPDS